MSSAPTLVTAPAFVGAIAWISVCLGRRAMRLLGLGSAATAGERVLVAGALGLGLLQFVPFLLGTFGLLGTTEVRISLLAVGLPTLVDVPGAAAAVRPWLARCRAIAWWQWTWGVLVVAALVGTLFAALAPSFDPDGVGYHLAAPKRWLQVGALEYLPTLMHTHGPMGTELLYALGLATVGDCGAKLLHFAASLAAAAGLLVLAARFGRRFPAESGARLLGYIAAALFLLGPAVGIRSVMGASYAEGTTSLAIVASCVCWLIWLDSDDQSWLRGAAVLAGLAVTFKLTAILFPLALAALTVAVAARGRGAAARPSWGDARFRIGLLVLCVLPVAPWMIRSTVITGNPVYPIFARWIPSRHFPPEVSRAFEEYNRYLLWGTSGQAADLSLRARKAVLAGVVLGVLAIGALVWSRQRDPLHRRVTVVVVATIAVQLAAAGLYTRYWVPMVAVLQVLILAPLVSRLSARTTRAIMFVGLLVLSARATRDFVRDDPAGWVLASVRDADRRELRDQLLPLLPLTDAANELAGPDEAVYVYKCCNFYVDGPAVSGGTLDTTLRFTDWEVFNDDLAELGVGFVIAPTLLVTDPQAMPIGTAGAVSNLVAEAEIAVLSRLLIERGEQLATAADYSLFRVTPDA